MATVTKEIADDIIAGKYPEDGAYKIVKYTDMGSKDAYGVIFKGEDPFKYDASEHIHNPSVYWTEPGYVDPEFLSVTMFVPPNGMELQLRVTNISPDDMAWFKAKDIKVSCEELGAMVCLYGDVGLKDEDGIPNEAIVLSNGRTSEDTFAELRKECEKMLTRG